MMDSVVNYWGTGRRKNAVARVLLRVGNGRVTINNREVDDYLPRFFWKTQAMEPLKVAGVEGRVDIFVNAHGGGLTGQSGAIRMGIARAILKLNPDTRPALKRAGMLRRDSRMVERKKFGQKGARGKRQFSKR
jgi:small subunit ribosomal protein S9